MIAPLSIHSSRRASRKKDLTQAGPLDQGRVCGRPTVRSRLWRNARAARSTSTRSTSMAEFRRFLQKKTTGFIATPDDRAMAAATGLLVSPPLLAESHLFGETRA